MPPNDPPLSPHDIAQGLRDIGRISPGDADRLEERITAWGQAQKATGRTQGISEAIALASLTAAAMKNATHRTAAQKLVTVLKRLVPDRSPDYLRGYKDGSAAASQKGGSHQPT